KDLFTPLIELEPRSQSGPHSLALSRSCSELTVLPKHHLSIGQMHIECSDTMTYIVRFETENDVHCFDRSNALGSGVSFHLIPLVLLGESNVAHVIAFMHISKQVTASLAARSHHFHVNVTVKQFQQLRIVRYAPLVIIRFHF